MKNKEEIKRELLDTINRYYSEYNLPEMSINDGEFDALIDTVYIYLLHDKEHALNLIIRKALNLSMMDEYNCFNMYHIIKSLDDLIVFGLKIDDIEKMKQKIMIDSLLNNAKKSCNMTK